MLKSPCKRRLGLERWEKLSLRIQHDLPRMGGTGPRSVPVELQRLWDEERDANGRTLFLGQLHGLACPATRMRNWLASSPRQPGSVFYARRTGLHGRWRLVQDAAAGA